MNVRALPAPIPVPWRWVWWTANAAAMVLLAAWWSAHANTWGNDVPAYWSVRDGVSYDVEWPTPGFVYSPAFGQAISPLTLLPLPAFAAAWQAIQIAAVAWLATPVLAVVLVYHWHPVWGPNLLGGNIYILLALALVLSRRWPAAWTFLVLTKITPGVGLVWYAVRREWRYLGIATGVTIAVIAVSALLDADAWPAWIGMLIASADNPIPADWPVLPLPLALRGPLALIVVAIGARRDWWWTIPVAVLLSFPMVGWSALPVLLALLAPLRGPRFAIRNYR